MNRGWTILALCFWMSQRMLFASAGLETCDPKATGENCCCTEPVEAVSCCAVPVEKEPCTCHFENAPEPTAPMASTQPSPSPRLPLLAVLSLEDDFLRFRDSEEVFHAIPTVGMPSARHRCALLQMWRC